MNSNLMDALLDESKAHQVPLEVYSDRDSEYSFEVAVVLEVWDDAVLHSVLNLGKFDGVMATKREAIFQVSSGTQYLDALTVASREAATFLERMELPAFSDFHEYLAYLVREKIPTEFRFDGIVDKVGLLLAFDHDFLDIQDIDELTLRFDGRSIVSAENLMRVWSHSPKTARRVALAQN